MSNLDDKILGEKTHYYCSSSSSEDEADDDDQDGRFEREVSVQSKIKWEGTSCNTGPKGVIEDFQRYKKFENERRENREKAKLERIKKCSITCQNKSSPSPTTMTNTTNQPLIVTDFGDLDDENDPFIKEYIAKRMKEMLDRYQQKEISKRFGELKFLNNGEQFLKLVDDPSLKDTLIVTHIYNHKIAECNLMNDCLAQLAKKYSNVMFCSLDSGTVGMSREFTKYGVPALLIYKNGDLIGNFVSLGDEFGTNFDEKDVEDFLVENNILVSSQLISSISVNSDLSKIQKDQRTKEID